MKKCNCKNYTYCSFCSGDKECTSNAYCGYQIPTGIDLRICYYKGGKYYFHKWEITKRKKSLNNSPCLWGIIENIKTGYIFIIEAYTITFKEPKK